MIKVGDKLIYTTHKMCYAYSEFFSEGDICIITKQEINQNYYVYNTESGKFGYFHNDEYDALYIHNWFYTLAEWRERQINSILDE